MLIDFLIFYAVAVGLCCFLGAMFNDILDHDYTLPQVMVAAVAWPITLIAILRIGIAQWQKDFEKGTGLSLRQQRKIAFQKKLLEIDRQRNDEFERSLKIIQQP